MLSSTQTHQNQTQTQNHSHNRHAGAAGLPNRGYRGPERRTASRDPTACLVGMLDEIDYGMLLVSPDGQVNYMNHAARLELDDQHPLLLKGHALCALRSQDVVPLQDALAAAQRGLRRLLTLGENNHRVSISVVPLLGAGGAGTGGLASSAIAATNASGPGAAGSAAPIASQVSGVATLLVLGKRQVCESLSVQGFARSVHLTPAETRVLEGLCKGTRPIDIAKGAGVAVSTVRTQIGSIRAKTGATSIRDLVQQVAVLPPLVGALRNGAVLGGIALGFASLDGALFGGSDTAQ